MAHFAELNDSNVVLRVVVIDNSDADTEANGIAKCKALWGADTNWKQTSYNTYGNTHRLDGTPFRKNYAGIGFTYDSARDAFISPKPFDSWTFNETTCLWEPPVAYPDDEKVYEWDESTTNWVEAS